MSLRMYPLGLAVGAAVLGLQLQTAMADPNVESRIEDLKSKTAELVAGQAALETRAPAERLSLPPAIWRVSGAIVEFKDCINCPDMVVIPAGEFTMGSPAFDLGAEAQHRVTISYPNDGACAVVQLHAGYKSPDRGRADPPAGMLLTQHLSGGGSCTCRVEQAEAGRP